MMIGMMAYFVAMAVDQFSYLLTDKMVSVLLVVAEVVLFAVGTGDFAKMVEFVILSVGFMKVFESVGWWVGMLRMADF